jgi:hypothetical protein
MCGLCWLGHRGLWHQTKASPLEGYADWATTTDRVLSERSQTRTIFNYIPMYPKTSEQSSTCLPAELAHTSEQMQHVLAHTSEQMQLLPACLA